ncbi:MAG: chemotaxis response regulator protein-glutamate methylesterase [Sphingomonas bacterium]|uniref:chemotaxis protein CheB n=1 Tax=Sphingomonas bacterium TaxID=1895847 RepID=UPI00261DB85A|nr:chemotaxis protein CheB [Sphingomonas bacterium]MDB5706106.1 chemotaxis response regulator protein-glutamate methylesterase [Sphingomonas bacterium]
MTFGSTKTSTRFVESRDKPRILIVDDSVVARAVIARAIDAGGRFAVAGAVPHAKAALAFLHGQRVDGILLDIEMPGVDGLTALPELIAASKGAKVLIVSSSCGDGAVATIEALSLGAADTLVKPDIGDFAGRFSATLDEKLSRLFETTPTSSAAMPLATDRAGGGFDIVAIGASTGGIHALSQLLREIPASFPLPILITQHLPDSFMPYFAAQVAVLAGRPCEVATDHMRIRPGRVIIAPGAAHIRVVGTSEGAAVRLSTEPSKSGCTPSVDPMFESLAEVYGSRALAIVLSGMGKDGSEGAQRVIDRGGSVVVQDQASSVVWGMPGAIATNGTACAIMPPKEIGKMVASRRRPGC